MVDPVCYTEHLDKDSPNSISVQPCCLRNVLTTTNSTIHVVSEPTLILVDLITLYTSPITQYQCFVYCQWLDLSCLHPSHDVVSSSK